jgi:hypothetical protein
MPERPQSAFEAGRDTGRQDQTLAEHSEHLEQINGSIEKAAQGMVDVATELALLRAEAERRRERAARLYKYTTLTVTVVLGILTVISFLRGSPF